MRISINVFCIIIGRHFPRNDEYIMVKGEEGINSFSLFIFT